MLPSILSGSRLHLALRGAAGRRSEVGDVVCFLDGSGRFVSHRVVAAVRAGASRRLTVAGDGSGSPETIDEAAVVGVVTRVEHPLLSYDADGLIGSWFARSAVRRTIPFRGALVAFSVLSRVRAISSRIGRRLVRAGGLVS